MDLSQPVTHYYKALINIGIPEKDRDSRRTIINFQKGRTVVKWYKGADITKVMDLTKKTRYAKIVFIKNISFKDYTEGVFNHHEY